MAGEGERERALDGRVGNKCDGKNDSRQEDMNAKRRREGEDMQSP